MSEDEILSKLSIEERELISQYKRRLQETEQQLHKMKSTSIQESSLHSSHNISKTKNKSPATRLSPVVFNQTNRMDLQDTNLYSHSSIDKEHMQRLIDKRLKEQNLYKDELYDEAILDSKFHVSVRPTLALNSETSMEDYAAFQRKKSDSRGINEPIRSEGKLHKALPKREATHESIRSQSSAGHYCPKVAESIRSDFRNQLDAKYKACIEKKRREGNAEKGPRGISRGRVPQKTKSKTKEKSSRRCAKLGKGGVRRLLELVTEHIQDCPSFAAALDREGFL